MAGTSFDPVLNVTLILAILSFVISKLSDRCKSKVTCAYLKALQTVWWMIAAIAVVSVLIVFLETHVDLQTAHATEFGIAEWKIGGNEAKKEEVTTSSRLKPMAMLG